MSSAVVTEQTLREGGWRERTNQGFSALVGPIWSRREKDAWMLGVLTGDQHANVMGIVHGGLIATLMDQVLSVAAWEALSRTPCVTVQLDMHCLAPAQVGQFLEARGQVLRMTNSLVFVRGEISAGSDLIASGQAVLKKVRGQAATGPLQGKR